MVNLQWAGEQMEEEDTGGGVDCVCWGQGSGWRRNKAAADLGRLLLVF